MSKTYQVRVATLNSADALALQQAGWEPFAAALTHEHNERWSGGGGSGGSHTPAHWDIIFRKEAGGTPR